MRYAGLGGGQKTNSALNKLTDGDLIQFASNPPQYQGLCLPNKGDLREGGGPAAEGLGEWA